MADPLSLVASIIAVAQISGKIVSLCYDYRSSHKHVDHNIMRLANEVKSFRDFLEALISNIDAIGTDTMTPQRTKLLTAKGGPLTEALDDLKELEGKLKPAEGWQGFKRNPKWPLRETDILQTLDRLNRIKTTLNAAATIDHLTISTGTYKVTEQILSDTEEIHSL
jgi:major membrane immunogen (membrane-anchored lipoprotein)